MATSDLQFEQSGGSKSDIKRAHTHEENVSMAGNRVFFDNLSSVIKQAVIQNYDILDCIVMIDLCCAPPSIQLMLSSEFVSNEMSPDDENYNHTRRMIGRNRENGALTVACISIGVYDETNAPRAILFKTVPFQKVEPPMGSWTEVQADAKQSLGFSVEDMHPAEVEKLLDDLKRAKC